MRVALFFDGKNHMKNLQRAAEGHWLNHGALADWVVNFVGGTELFAAYYYTGIPLPTDETNHRRALTDLLEELDKRPGFFVKRFNRRITSRECPHCGELITYTEEKMVDTSLVADMILLAVQDAYDVAVVFSGDLDLAPGLDAVHSLGKKAWIATFGDTSLSRTLARAAWGHIDLLDQIEAFSYGDLLQLPTRVEPRVPEEVDSQVLRELRRAEIHFGSRGGFVGARFFLHRWKGREIPDHPELRRQSVERLVESQLVELYTMDGQAAVRTSEQGQAEAGEVAAE
ncbi:MAG: NYN domain-containing protein [Deltaproteobacteria bacterium]|nr:NYN domain-containing protein [Deltaproteobacteria bacterium]